MTMITITRRALQMMQERMQSPEQFIRIKVTAGGCAGMTYDAEIDQQLGDGEAIVQCEGGVRIVADQASRPFLEGLTIDYSDDLISAGFRFSNSANDSSCGCGASFALSGFPLPNMGGASCGS